MRKLALFGYGGHAREVAVQIDQPITFFVDDEYASGDVKPISMFDPNMYIMMVAVADSAQRERIVNKLPKETTFFKFIHPTALIMDKNIEIGEGSFIGAYTILTTNIKIGKHSILNRGNQIGHDSVIGDYFSAMPGAIVSGNVTINNKVYLGTNSTVIEKTMISSNVIVGANGVVIDTINLPGTYVGVPVKQVKKYDSKIK